MFTRVSNKLLRKLKGWKKKGNAILKLHSKCFDKLVKIVR